MGKPCLTYGCLLARWWGMGNAGLVKMMLDVHALICVLWLGHRWGWWCLQVQSRWWTGFWCVGQTCVLFLSLFAFI